MLDKVELKYRNWKTYYNEVYCFFMPGNYVCKSDKDGARFLWGEYILEHIMSIRTIYGRPFVNPKLKQYRPEESKALLKKARRIEIINNENYKKARRMCHVKYENKYGDRFRHFKEWKDDQTRPDNIYEPTQNTALSAFRTYKYAWLGSEYEHVKELYWMSAPPFTCYRDDFINRPTPTPFVMPKEIKFKELEEKGVSAKFFDWLDVGINEFVMFPYETQDGPESETLDLLIKYPNTYIVTLIKGYGTTYAGICMDKEDNWKKPIPENTSYLKSIVFSTHSKEAGSLEKILKIFSDYGVNLTKIYTRPKKTKIGSYYFFVEMEIDCLYRPEQVTKFLDKIKSNTTHYREIGSYKGVD